MLKRTPLSLLIVLGGAVLFIPFLGTTHLFDWDEINFAEASREMLVTGNYSIPQINFQPFWEKPPLFFWLQVMSMKVFGVNEFAARFPNAVCGIVTLLLLYRLGKKLVNEKFGLFWALIYAGSLLPHFYFKSGIIDPWFNLLIFLSIYHLAAYSTGIQTYSVKSILLAGLFAGLAMMTKGPVAILVIGLCYTVFALINRFRNFIKLKDLFLFVLLVSLVGSIWFIALWLNGQQHIIREFIAYQVKLFSTEDAGHGGPFFYHFIILLIGCFPAAVLSLLSMKANRSDTEIPFEFHRWMLILFWTVLILFSIVKTKIVHYSSLCYFPLTFLAAVSFYRLYQNRSNLPSWNRWLQFGTGLLLAIAIMGVTFIDRIKPWLLRPGRIKDEFARANLQANVSWNGFEILPGVLLLVALVVFLFRSKYHIQSSLLVLFLTSIIAFNTTISFITPKVEPYSQGAAIEFYESKQGQRVIVEPLGFKSYAHLFYTRKTQDLGKLVSDSIIQFNIHPDVEVYYVGKIHKMQRDTSTVKNLQKLYDKNGFVFYKLNR